MTRPPTFDKAFAPTVSATPPTEPALAPAAESTDTKIDRLLETFHRNGHKECR
jgi:hypothetical protein